MKHQTRFVCQSCGAISQRWIGKCNLCNAWDTYIEEVVPALQSDKKSSIQSLENKIVALQNIPNSTETRIMSGIAEFDRVLGGGITPGSLILLGGDPGIGKSTLMLQLCAALQMPTLYITGEESLQQIKMRSSRMSAISKDLQLLAETRIKPIVQILEKKLFQVVVIDSIQTMMHEDVGSTPGSISQVRECAALLMQAAKKTNTAVFIIGHVTKDGAIAGPKVLEHTVDTVLQFEGEKTYSYRIVRAIKNRYGSTNEIGIFEMAEHGLQEVSNPSEIFLAQRNRQDSGTAIVAAIEGTRPLLIEVQALVSPSGFSMPQRTSNGFEVKRLHMILAVLEKRLGLEFRKCDVFVNIAGGLSLDDPAVDLGVAAALTSSYRDSPIDSDIVLIGEIGLSGEIRPVSALKQRLNEIEKLGFKGAITPKFTSKETYKPLTIKVMQVDRISLALSEILA